MARVSYRFLTRRDTGDGEGIVQALGAMQATARARASSTNATGRASTSISARAQYKITVMASGDQFPCYRFANRSVFLTARSSVDHADVFVFALRSEG